MDNKKVLAMYDIRGKQAFIFRTNKLKEIVGGSWIIRDLFNDYLYDVAKDDGSKGIFNYNDKSVTDEEKKFTKKNFEKHLQEGYIGEVVYDGGGNFLLLFEDKDTFKDVTYRFTKKVYEEVGTLQVLAACTEIDNFSNFERDRKELYKKHRELESSESVIDPWACLPIVQVDRATSLPIAFYDKSISEKYSKESWAKIRKYNDNIKIVHKRREGVDDDKKDAEALFVDNINILDELVHEKGEDSQLAVLFIDGNGMGARVQNILKKAKSSSYEDCVEKMREFSEKIRDVYTEKGIKSAFNDSKDKSGNDYKKHRIVVYSGDETSFIVQARDAYNVARSYLDSFDVDGDDSACAGIAIFHSHAPYADAYRIAEECCESGKKWMKDNEIDNACLIDYHICQGAIGTSLDNIRDKDVGKLCSKPWLYTLKGVQAKENDKAVTIAEVEQLKQFFNTIGHSNVKDLAKCAKVGEAELEMELKRIEAHQSDTDRKEEQWKFINHMDKEKRRKLIYDVVLAYDFWFKGGK